MRCVLLLAMGAEAAPCLRHMRTSEAVADEADCDPIEGISAFAEEEALGAQYTPKPTPAVTYNSLDGILADVDEMKANAQDMFDMLNASRQLAEDAVRNANEGGETVSFERAAKHFIIPSLYNLVASKYNTLAVAADSNYKVGRRLGSKVNGLRDFDQTITSQTTNISGFIQQQESSMHSSDEKLQSDVDNLKQLYTQLHQFDRASHRVLSRQGDAIVYIESVQNELESQIEGIQDLMRGLLPLVVEGDEIPRFDEMIANITGPEIGEELEASDSRTPVTVATDNKTAGRI